MPQDCGRRHRDEINDRHDPAEVVWVPTDFLGQAHGSCTSVPQMFPSGRMWDAQDTGPQDQSLRLCRSAEGVGFEPTRTRQRPSGFQDLRLNLADQQ
jgi:hypothetical protein